MERFVANMKSEKIDIQKIKEACGFVFEYMKEYKFTLREVDALISSMGHISSKMTQNDPLREVQMFDYSSCIEDSFDFSAVSNTKS